MKVTIVRRKTYVDSFIGKDTNIKKFKFVNISDILVSAFKVRLTGHGLLYSTNPII